ncbi:hypothetical protein D3C83_184750 [compost metagenome]
MFLGLEGFVEVFVQARFAGLQLFNGNLQGEAMDIQVGDPVPGYLQSSGCAGKWM